MHLGGVNVLSKYKENSETRRIKKKKGGAEGGGEGRVDSKEQEEEFQS